MPKKIRLLYFISFLLLPNLILSQSEEKTIIETVQQFFNALESRDTTLARNVLLYDGQFFSVRESNSNINIKKTTHSNFIKKLNSSNEPIRETMHDPVVLIHKQVAIVWTKYEFYKNEEYSHNGVDAFSLLKTSDGWRIAGIIYNIE
ncbi:MAG: nuclear transport factor 2 family protein [Calditrichia bacterium]|nr:nuclear transport factor 2 family protein [Calditrichia bacterium]